MEEAILVESSEAQAEAKQVLQIEEDALKLWVANDEEGVKIANLIKKVMELWNYRLSNDLRTGFLPYIQEIMALHGVPFIMCCTPGGGSRTDFNFKYLPSCSIYEFFSSLSNLECRIRKVIYIVDTLLAFHKQLNIESARRKFSPFVRISSLTRKLNYKAVAFHLGNYYQYRFHITMIQYEGRDVISSAQQTANYFLETPLIMNMILQILIGAKTNPRTDLRLYLRRLAENSLSFVYLSKKQSILPILTEILCTSIILGLLDVATDVIFLETNLKVRQKTDEESNTHNVHKMLLFYEQFRKGDLLSGSRVKLAEDTMILYESLSDAPFFLPEISLRVQAALGGREEEISEAVSTVMRQQPRFLGRLLPLLRELKLDYEVDIAIETACSNVVCQVHESSITWLDWCEERINEPRRFGIVQEVLLKCVNKLFHFLDYASNRTNARAWKQMWKIVQKVPPDSVVVFWNERKDWWPKFHNCYFSDADGESLRSEVLTALATELRS